MNKMLFKKLFLSGLLGFALFLPTIALAQNTGVTGYTPLAPIPELMDKTGGQVDINSFIPGAIKLAISIASALSVIFIIYGGVLYITTDSMGGKSNAKDTIENAIMGLLLAIGSYAILYTINPKLVVFTINLTELKGTGIDFDGANNGPVLTPTTEDLGKSLEGCNDCSEFPVGVAYKPAQLNGCKMPGPCVINTELGFRLLELTEALKSKTPTILFQVTESFPPTRIHFASCQLYNKPDSGHCVDANFAGGTYAGEGGATTVRLVREFITESKKLGLVSIYEVTTESTRNLLVAAEGIEPGDVVVPRMPLCSTQKPVVVDGRQSPACCPTAELRDNSPRDETCSWISANHFSVYKNAAVYNNRTSR